MFVVSYPHFIVSFVLRLWPDNANLIWEATPALALPAVQPKELHALDVQYQESHTQRACCKIDDISSDIAFPRQEAVRRTCFAHSGRFRMLRGDWDVTMTLLIPVKELRPGVEDDEQDYHQNGSLLSISACDVRVMPSIDDEDTRCFRSCHPTGVLGFWYG